MKLTPAIAILALLSTAGCFGPNKANVDLRKKNQELSQKVETLTKQHEADLAYLATADQKQGAVPRLSADRLNELFTASTVEVDKLSNWRDGLLKVYVVPIDAAGDTLKAAGAVTVEAYDLAKADKPLLGKWEFPAADAGKNWYDSFVVRGYALNCPIASPLDASEITIRATFVDSLTQRTLTAQRVIKVAPAAIAPK